MSADLLERLTGVAAQLSAAARAAGSNRPVPAIDVTAAQDVLDQAERHLLARRAAVLDSVARRARNLAADLAQVQHGTSIDHVDLLAAIGGLRRALLVLDEGDGEADAERSGRAA